MILGTNLFLFFGYHVVFEPPLKVFQSIYLFLVVWVYNKYNVTYNPLTLRQTSLRELFVAATMRQAINEFNVQFGLKT